MHIRSSLQPCESRNSIQCEISRHSPSKDPPLRGLKQGWRWFVHSVSMALWREHLTKTFVVLKHQFLPYDSNAFSRIHRQEQWWVQWIPWRNHIFCESKNSSPCFAALRMPRCKWPRSECHRSGRKKFKSPFGEEYLLCESHWEKSMRVRRIRDQRRRARRQKNMEQLVCGYSTTKLVDC